MNLLTIADLTRSMALALSRDFGDIEPLLADADTKIGTPGTKQINVDFYLSRDEMRPPIDDICVKLIEPAAAALSHIMRESGATGAYPLALPTAPDWASSRVTYNGMMVRGLLEGPLRYPAVPYELDGKWRVRFDVLFRQTVAAKKAA